MRTKNLLLFCLFSGLGANAVAGANANPHAVVANGELVEIERPAQILTETDASFGATVRDRRQNSGHILRCWQQGRLLYEGSGFIASRPAGNGNAAATLVVERQGGESVTVLNLQDGLCILSDR
ncbi:MAG: hypothetical protein LBQ62_01605 [Candidatus Accumulibacter sp.]|jgi:hypothetical protein|nr:hypothetical protein [Accumulibacter sp.]